MCCFFISMNNQASLFFFFFFNDTATTEIYTLSLHDALPISPCAARSASPTCRRSARSTCRGRMPRGSWTSSTRTRFPRSEEHTSELQSQSNLVCRLLLEKKKKRVSRYLTRDYPRSSSP